MTGARDDERLEFGLTWPGRRAAVDASRAPPSGSLAPSRRDSVDFDGAENVLIEGDNLEVLRLLRPAYQRAAALVYLDPPYNTGGELIYPDNFRDSARTYLRLTGQLDDEGLRSRSRAELGGRVHSRWLSMMYPRLALARELLAPRGFLCASISDHECAPLRMLLDELLGEERFVAQLVWRARQFPDARAKTRVSTDHEYVLVYRADAEASFRGVPRDESKFRNPDGDPRGPWMSRSMLGLATRERRPRLHYEITDPESGRRYAPPPESGWRYGQETMARLIEEERVLFPRKAGGRPREKKFRAALQHARACFPSIIDGVHTADGTRELRELLGFQAFDFPKPSELLRVLVEQTCGPEGLVVDLFAGSGTMGHAVARQNARDGGRRRYLCVQLPVPLESESEAARRGLRTIADITRARLARVAERPSSGGGFRLFRLTAGRPPAWRGGARAPADLAEALRRRAEPSRAAGASGEELEARVFELALAAGYPLTTKVERVSLGRAGQPVYAVDGGSMLICLEGRITRDCLEAMQARRPTPTRCVLLDSAFAGDDALLRDTARAMRAAGVRELRLL